MAQLRRSTSPLRARQQGQFLQRAVDRTLQLYGLGLGLGLLPAPDGARLLQQRPPTAVRLGRRGSGGVLWRAGASGRRGPGD